ncbi:hypothetical protein MOV58_05565 [Staphylococcus hominis]|uniref:hypothetical protein n=1 Tax=Staphylococcus hominis TaxID=1290 RepID=UPI0010DD5044|nr:hypothetical protein [Staphylococcus hominis]MCI2852815.1 hypothetical protein [Staphylococcus hominis]TBW92716.1 hypothetical protein EQ808_05355 [Staphylococcus hominis]UNQ69044.1 hypothetical protein MOV58_05565 [Staphylococcus hominis]
MPRFNKLDQSKHVVIRGEDLNDLLIKFDTEYEEDYFNFITNKDEIMIFEEEIEKETEIIVYPKLVKKIHDIIKEKSMKKIEENYESAILINTLSYEYKVEIPKRIKTMLYEGKLRDLSIETIAELCGYSK